MHPMFQTIFVAKNHDTRYLSISENVRYPKITIGTFSDSIGQSNRHFNYIYNRHFKYIYNRLAVT